MRNRLQIERWLSVVAVISVIAILSQLLAVPYRNYTSILSNSNISSNLPSSNNSQSVNSDVLGETNDSGSDEESLSEEERQLPSESSLGSRELTFHELVRKTRKDNRNSVVEDPSPDGSLKKEIFRSGVGFPSPINGQLSLGRKSVLKNRTSPISYMTTLLLQGSPSLKPPKSLSARDKELEHAMIQIENAPIIRDAPKDYASLFRNYSTFIKSYELMERVLRVYIYKEGQKPVFHKPHLKGIYASEGWFMKLMEGSRRFAVRDPRKAHLFYLPFSSRRLRSVLYQQNFPNHRDLKNHLKNYVQIIAAKYSFWNRTKGADHFLVACHDWAPGLTKSSMRTCIRAICNSNLSKGFEIGKDVSLPVTNVHLAEDPEEAIGGNRPSERHILAFFSGSMHGNLRPVLLKHWSNKEPDMKIFGPLGHDATGAARYKEFMKSSKYCICARGYEVHTPRVMESIYYECVPVIISDDYVPPLFDVFVWESFSVFVLEEDVPDLRNILLSIPENKYIEMQKRVKMVQQHFLWHKMPVKYDLFHMILHSIWYKRVFQVKSR